MILLNKRCNLHLKFLDKKVYKTIKKNNQLEEEITRTVILIFER